MTFFNGVDVMQGFYLLYYHNCCIPCQSEVTLLLALPSKIFQDSHACIVTSLASFMPYVARYKAENVKM